jgi:hypothetical protein
MGIPRPPGAGHVSLRKEVEGRDLRGIIPCGMGGIPGIGGIPKGGGTPIIYHERLIL